MVEVFKNNHADVWHDFATGQSNDWERVSLLRCVWRWRVSLIDSCCGAAQALEGYQAAVDFPVCTYYKELAEAYPDAKVRTVAMRDVQLVMVLESDAGVAVLSGRSS
jgi:hypothetical protein